MTDQKYKLVPTRLTPEMGHTGDAIIDDDGSMQAMWDGMLEVAPEVAPVAFVPVHPKNGPLWSDTYVAGSQPDRANYPVMPLYAPHAAAPAPVCRWKGGEDADYVVTDCGEQLLNDGPYPFPFCPHCGKRVQLREEVDDD